MNYLFLLLEILQFKINFLTITIFCFRLKSLNEKFDKIEINTEESLGEDLIESKQVFSGKFFTIRYLHLNYKNNFKNMF